MMLRVFLPPVTGQVFTELVFIPMELTGFVFEACYACFCIGISKGLPGLGLLSMVEWRFGRGNVQVVTVSCIGRLPLPGQICDGWMRTLF